MFVYEDNSNTRKLFAPPPVNLIDVDITKVIMDKTVSKEGKGVAEQSGTRGAQVGGDGYESGFADGSDWPKILKKMVKKGKGKPNLVMILAIKGPSDLTPESLVTMYSLSCYIQSSQKHIASYAKLARLINTSDQIPDTTEMVKIVGFETSKDG